MSLNQFVVYVVLGVDNLVSNRRVLSSLDPVKNKYLSRNIHVQRWFDQDNLDKAHALASCKLKRTFIGLIAALCLLNGEKN